MTHSLLALAIVGFATAFAKGQAPDNTECAPPALCYPPDPGSIVSWSCLDVQWGDGLIPSALLGCSGVGVNVSATWHPSTECGSCDPCEVFDFDGAADCSRLGSMASGASACAVAGWLDYASACASAATFEPSLTWYEARTDYCGTRVSNDCVTGYLLGSWAITQFSLAFAPGSGSNTSWTVTVSSSIVNNLLGDAPTGAMARSVLLLRLLPIDTVDVIGLSHAGPLSAATGMTFNSSTGVWNGEIVTGGIAGEYQLTTAEISFNDEFIDVDADRRLNALDVGALERLLGSTQVSHLEKWDFNSSGDIDAEDVLLLNAVVASGFQSGVFADADGDLDADCDDLTASVGKFGFELGDPEYFAALDADLDGVTDNNDRHWVHLKILPGDITADGVVGQADVGALLAAYGTCIGDPAYNIFADLDASGCVGQSDLGLLNAAYGSSCPGF